MVKRYSMGLNGPERLLTMLNIRDGDYVRYSDYAKLESALRECVHQIECVRGYYSILPNDDPKLVYAITKAREVLGDA